jgi:glycosyltransferase involved in cell wall biosynthesis
MPTTDSERTDASRIVLVIGTLQGGGAERQISEMANYWVRKDMRVTLATWSGPEVEDFYSLDRRVNRVFLDVQMEPTAMLSRVRAHMRRVRKLRALLATMRPDAVLSFVTESNVLTILSSLGLGVRTVVSERTQPALHLKLPPLWRMLRRLLYAWSDGIVAQTSAAASWIERHCRKRVRVIANALRSLPAESHDRQRLVIGVGRLSHEKGFDLLLRAFARIARGFDDWRVVIIGEGAERENLLRLRDDLALVDRVEFLGQTADVCSWMARAALMVQPSRYEGFPNAVLEGMGMGAAVISADCHSGPAELIDDGVNGRLVPVDDVATLAVVMAELMSRQDIRERLGREASKVRTQFRQDLIMAQWEEVLLPMGAPAQMNARPGPG